LLQSRQPVRVSGRPSRAFAAPQRPRRLLVLFAAKKGSEVSKRSASDGTVTSESLLTAVAPLGYMIGDVGQDETREPGHDNGLLKWSEPGKPSFAPIR
jgi:hypothetical protein